ncbi:MAG: hypothetical protein NC388_03755 [Clostridium sp.]|nr:hypothetical protein [Clostridium sp.]
MNNLLKNLGILLIVLTAVGMMAAYVTGGSDSNALMGALFAVMIIGLITHIVINKKIID